MRASPNTIDEVREIAAEVEAGSTSPLAAAQLIVSTQMETPAGAQSRFLIIPTAIPIRGRDPSVLLTCRDRAGNRGWKVMNQNQRGGVLPVVRATNVPEVGIWATTDPNYSGQRLRVGGLGINGENYREFDLGYTGWRGDSKDGHVFRWHPVVAEHVVQNPDERIGYYEVMVNDGSFVPMSPLVELPGHFISDKREGHETIATVPVLGRAMLLLSSEIMTF